MNSELTMPNVRQPARPQPRSHTLVDALVTIVLMVVLLPAAMILGVLAIYETNHLILPGVSVSGMDLSSLTREQAAARLNELWNIQRTLTLSDGEHTWTAQPIDYGLFLDQAATARAAYLVGRGSYQEELLQILTRKTREGSPVVVFNQDLAKTELDKIAGEVYIPAKEAELRFENGKYLAEEGKPGLMLNIAAAMVQIQADPLLMLMQGEVKLSYLPLEPQVKTLSADAERRQKLLSKPLKMRAYDPISDETFTWTIPVEELLPYISIREPLADQPTATLDAKVLDAYLAKWQKDTLGSGRVFETVQGRDKLNETWNQGKELFAMIRRLPTSYVVRPGDTLYSISAKVGIPYWRIQNANPGMKANGFSTGQKIVIPSKNDMLPLPVVINKRIVISISEQRMWTYENGKLRSKHVISTGMADSPTMPGVFQVTEHVINAYGERWDLWMPHWLSIYEAVPTFFNGIHGLPLLRNGVRLWGNVLGKPASYGCIIMSLTEAESTYNWAEDGVVVEIKP